MYVVSYCRSEPDIAVLNKIAETVSLTAQRMKGRMSIAQKDVFEDALENWDKGYNTPGEFKGIFRGGN